MTKIKIVMSLLLISISFHATSSLDGECSTGTERAILSNKHISKYFVATNISEKDYAFKIEVEGKWFKTVLKEKNGEEQWGYRDQLSSTARIAKILHLPVNLCVDHKEGGYLLGIELY